MPTDQMLTTDARAYQYSNYQSVLPLPDWGTLTQWRRRRAAIRQHLLLCAGLNARTAAFRARGQVVRRFEHEGVIVENLCIETLPGLYVVGNLYRPKTKNQVPLVLHPHGHAMHARTVPLDLYSVPHRAFNTALNGCAAFAYSMIGYDHDTMQLDHRSLLSGPEKPAANLLGLSMFGLQLNNSVKALDYLLRRKQFDPKRVGCTGESGGGTQTYFLAAVDERVSVAAPAVMLSGHFQGGCVCENAPQLHLQYSNLEYAGLIAPRPLFLTGCSGDWTHHARERELPTMRALYELYGAADRVDLQYQDEQHNYNRASREAVYAWMVRWLLNKGAAGAKRLPESKLAPPSTQDLLVFDGPVPPISGAIRSQKKLFDMWRDTRVTASVDEIADVLPFTVPAKDDILVRSQPPRHAYRKRSGGLHRIHYGRFSEDSSLDCRFLLPEKGRPTVLALPGFRDAGAGRRFCDRPPAALKALIESGCGVLVPQLFGRSGEPQEQAYQDRSDSYLASTYMPTPDSLRADDILTTVRLAQFELGIDPQSITTVADSSNGLLAWAAWALLTSQQKAGALRADFGGAYLTRERTWASRCYLPLLLGVGGAAALTGLGKGSGAISGVRRQDRGLLPKTWKVSAKRRTMAQLLASV